MGRVKILRSEVSHRWQDAFNDAPRCKNNNKEIGKLGIMSSRK